MSTFEEGTQILINYGLIRPRTLLSRPPIGHKTHYRNYDTTERGEYYLTYLIHWDAYITKFGTSKHHDSPLSFQARRCLESALIEYTINLWKGRLLYEQSHVPGQLSKLRVPKTVYGTFFRKLFTDLLGQIDRTHKKSPAEVSDELIERFLDELNVVDSGRSDSSEQSHYRIVIPRLISKANELELPLQLRYVYNKAAFKTFVLSHVHWCD